jgi:hypothetical protein
MPEKIHFGAIVLNGKDEILILKKGRKFLIPEGSAASDGKVSGAIPGKIREITGLAVEILEFFGVRNPEGGITLEFVCRTKTARTRARKSWEWVPAMKAKGLDLPSTAKAAIKAFYDKKASTNGQNDVNNLKRSAY